MLRGRIIFVEVFLGGILHWMASAFPGVEKRYTDHDGDLET